MEQMLSSTRIPRLPSLRQAILGLTLITLQLPAAAALEYAGGAGDSGYQDLATAGDYAYAATCAGLDILDIRNPLAPQLISQRHTPGCAQSVALSGSIAAVADSENGLQLIDVGTPTNPRLLGHLATAGTAQRIAVSGHLAFVTEESNTLDIIDFSDPATPRQIGAYTATGELLGVAATGSTLYLAAGAAGLLILDIADPTTPVEIGHYPLPVPDPYGNPGFARSVTLSGQLAYLLTDSSLSILNVSDPTSPRLVGIFDDDAMISWTYRFAVVGEQGVLLGLAPPPWIHIPGYSYLIVLDLHDPTAPAKLVEINLNNLSGESASAFKGTPLILPKLYSGALVFDLAGAETTLVAAGSSGAWATEVAQTNGVALVTDSSGRLDLYDVTHPTDPQWLNTFEEESASGYRASTFLAVAAEGNTACVLKEYGILILDIADLQHPVQIGAIGADVAGGHQITLADGILYLNFYDPNERSSLRWKTSLYDLHDPAAPRYLTTYAKGIRLAIDQGYAYLATGKGVEVLDIADPAQPKTKAKAKLPGALDIAVANDIVYALTADRLTLFRVTADRSRVKRLGEIAVDAPAERIAVANGVAYVLKGYGEGQGKPAAFRIDVSDPAQPRLLDSYPLEYGGGLMTVGDYLYRADGPNQLLILAGDPVLSRPAPPGGLTALSVDAGEVRLAWEDRSDNEEGFVLERAIGSGAWETLATLPADATDYGDTLVIPGKSYRYRVKAVNATGESAYSAIVKVKVPKANTL